MTPINKYELYEHSVQEPEVEAYFIKQLYHDLRRRQAKSMREDFCGTFNFCCEWVKIAKDHTAVGVDLSREPLAYGKRTHLKALTPDQASRIQLQQKNVLHVNSPKVDMVCAFNFSYYILKTRQQLLNYFKSTYKTLKKDGVFVIDAFGGTNTMDSSLEKRWVKGQGYRFKYMWEQMNYNPIRNEAKYQMHFKFSNGRVMRKAFSYDWRMWTIPEVREAMMDCGFKKTYVYWEGVNRKGEGNGKFRRQEVDGACDVWIAYIVGIK